jgi:hypothetical protein
MNEKTKFFILLLLLMFSLVLLWQLNQNAQNVLLNGYHTIYT